MRTDLNMVSFRFSFLFFSPVSLLRPQKCLSILSVHECVRFATSLRSQTGIVRANNNTVPTTDDEEEEEEEDERR